MSIETAAAYIRETLSGDSSIVSLNDGSMVSLLLGGNHSYPLAPELEQNFVSLWEFSSTPGNLEAVRLEFLKPFSKGELENLKRAETLNLENRKLSRRFDRFVIEQIQREKRKRIW